jgi:dipeptidyl aminopeptidase/acylaminoacyl peptidase
MRTQLFAIAALAASGALWAAPAARVPELPIEHFMKHPAFLDVKISPDGEYLAATALATEDTGMLVFLRRKDMQVTGHVRLAGRSIVSSFFWVNDERVVLTVAEKDGSLDTPTPTGEIFASNRDGTKQQLLIGGRAAMDSSGLVRGKEKRLEGAQVVDTLRDDDKNILVAVYRYDEQDKAFPKVERMNVYSGSRSIVARAPVMGADYVTDAKYQVRFAHGQTVDLYRKLYYRNDDDADWRLVNDEAATGLDVDAVGFSADGKHAYLQAEEKEGPDSIYQWNPATGERKLVARDAAIDPQGIAYTHDGVTPYAVGYFAGLPKLAVFDNSVPEAKLLKALQASFPGQWVSIRSYTYDGSELVMRVSSDRNPGDFYLLDKDKKATYLLSARNWIEPEQMGEMKPVAYSTRDGLTVHAFLTLPPGSDGKNLPLIVHPHGGPFGPFDSWGFNPEVQLLANRGYAVLQPNFRGSGNHGRKFERLGYQQWGGTMQDDLTDATHWAIREGIANKDRICIYGASYGGYASGMGIAKEPDLYRCAVGYVGLYDLALFYRVGDVKDYDSGKNYLKETVGTDPAVLGRGSPALMADRIKTPIFLIAGGEDERCPAEQSERFEKALKKAGKTVEYLYNPHEGHGFYKLESNQELYTRMLAWFDRYIGEGATAAVAGAPQPKPD